MTREILLRVTLQSGALFLAVWGAFSLVPSVPAVAKALVWRLAFLKPLACLLPFAVVPLYVLPAPRPAVVVPSFLESGSPAKGSSALAATSASAIPPTWDFDPFVVGWILAISSQRPLSSSCRRRWANFGKTPPRCR